jgi:hypothetical protein
MRKPRGRIAPVPENHSQNDDTITKVRQEALTVMPVDPTKNRTPMPIFGTTNEGLKFTPRPPQRRNPSTNSSQTTKKILWPRETHVWLENLADTLTLWGAH